MRTLKIIPAIVTLMIALGAGSAFANAPDSCDRDPLNANMCADWDRNKPCFRSGDAANNPTGVCAAMNGCTCVNPSGTPIDGCSIGAADGAAGVRAGLSTTVLLGVYFAGRAFTRRRRA